MSMSALPDAKIRLILDTSEAVSAAQTAQEQDGRPPPPPTAAQGKRFDDRVTEALDNLAKEKKGGDTPKQMKEKAGKKPETKDAKGSGVLDAARDIAAFKFVEKGLAARGGKVGGLASRAAGMVGAAKTAGIVGAVVAAVHGTAAAMEDASAFAGGFFDAMGDEKAARAAYFARDVIRGVRGAEYVAAAKGFIGAAGDTYEEFQNIELVYGQGASRGTNIRAVFDEKLRVQRWQGRVKRFQERFRAQAEGPHAFYSFYTTAAEQLWGTLVE